MNINAWMKRLGGPAALTLVLIAMLYLTVLLYSVGETVLALSVLIIAGFAAWTYSSAKTTAMRYLFPGVAAALVFVIFPMAYTVSIGFTNYGSKNLLDFERARSYLLDETYANEDDRSYAFTLYQRGPTYRLHLEDTEANNRTFVSPDLALAQPKALRIQMAAGEVSDADTALGLREVIAKQSALKALSLQLPSGEVVKLVSLRKFAPVKLRYQLNSDGSLSDTKDGETLKPNWKTGYFETTSGQAVQPGFKANVGLEHYVRIFTDEKFREPFIRIFIWTVVFSGLTVVFGSALGMLLAVLLSWENLRGRKVYQLLLFLPYAVPGFISILIFKGLFNQNLGEINLILEALFGIRPAWFSDPFLAKTMLLIVNTWLGFPYMMIVCMGLIKSIPADLYEASAVAGAGPLTNFFSITLPLVLKPITPLLISAFAFNFNNFVLITLLTGGRPDFLDTTVPAGTTDILVSYTFRIAFQDSGQHFGLASAISTVIFFIVAAITLVQMRYTKIANMERR